jgi:pyruvate dehydrogenase E2 component (dihydrolipoamide acetyltransferase)
MAEIIMPKMGDAMTEGKVIRWYKQPGDAVKRGEAVAEIETDKVNLDLEAEAEGTLGTHAASEGQMVPVGGVLARILSEGEKDEAAAAPVPAQKEEAPSDRPASRAPAFESEPSSGERQRSSPLARRMARELGVSLEDVHGSGPRGRIIAADVKGVATAGVPVATGRMAAGAPARHATAEAAVAVQKLETRTIPLTAIRRIIARRLAESTGPIPHFYLTADYDVTNLVSIRQQMVDMTGTKVSLNDFIIRAIALALHHHPVVNASWSDEAITEHGEVHIGVAVSTPEGLITPVIRNADEKSVMDIAAEVRALAEKAKNRKLKPDEYQGSTFTISNLGAWGIEEFTAIINPPNAAILAIGAAEARAIVDANRQIVVRDRMKVTLSCDHRIVDGAAGADFLRTLRQYIEQPLKLVMSTRQKAEGRRQK